MRRREFLESAGASAMVAGAASTPIVSSFYETTAKAQYFEQLYDPARGNLRDPQVLRFTVRDRAIVGKNGAFYNNRPLYCPHFDAAVLGGDRPSSVFLKRVMSMARFPPPSRTTARPSGYRDDPTRLDIVSVHHRLRDSSMPRIVAVLDAMPCGGESALR